MRNFPHFNNQKIKQHGGLLIEALIAVLIFSIGILALIGLQGVMLKNSMTSEFRAEAAYLAEKRAGEMWADPTNLVVDAAAVNISDLPNGKRLVTAVAGSPGTYKITIGWTAPGEPIEDATKATCGMDVAHCYSTVATIAGG